MRLSNVVMVIGASFLFTSDAFLMTTDTNKAKVPNLGSSSAQTHRHLRTHHFADLEERGLIADDLKYLATKAKSLGFNAHKAMNSVSYLQKIPKE
ncbi:Avirulence (Avh) protein [Phytophthora megakarya]|uniref:RxLR effector protein n=1 Tax=Phytophthora megakarya TaxID=4795 RepID=A0A225WYU9_9STRA|nr:Avirulence (Avh) protein [Phytophthora megakarya]